MERRDYIKKQIDELGKVLGKLLDKLLNNPKLPDTELRETLAQNISGQMDVSLLNIIDAAKENTLDKLIEDKCLNTSHIEQLASILLNLANRQVQNTSSKVDTYYASLGLYNYLNQNQSLYSLDVEFKINEIHNHLDELEKQ